MAEVVELKVNGDTHTFPVLTGTENEKAIDISKLRDLSGLITLDTGFKNTGSTKSAITFLDGDNGVLRYRGYPIEQLADQSNFVEVAYLLIYGELPNTSQLAEFNDSIRLHSNIHESYKDFLYALPSNTHPMGLLSAAVATMSVHDPASLNPYASQTDVDASIRKIIGQFPTIISWSHSRIKGSAFTYPVAANSYIHDFLRMIFFEPHLANTVQDPVIKAMDKLLILHADHEQNCSTSTVRIVGSSNANLYSSISAGVSALWGPLHGGANQEVIEMLEEIRKDGGGVAKYIDKAKDKNDNFRLMGFGHRVYKNFDPRATIIKKACDDVLNSLGIQDPVLEIAKQLEEVALKDDYFVQRKLYPNVDFYSGIIYRALGIPTEFFTVMFALGRLPGWIAQWKEMRENKEPIGRPRQVYTGAITRNYAGISTRK
jgi:citrate synthase